MLSKARKRKVFWLVLLTVVIFMLYFLTTMIGRKYHNSFIEIYGLKFLPTTINGSLQALIFILCIVLVFIDSFWGTGIALAFSILSISSVLRTVVKDLNLLNIPGVFNGVFNVLAIAFIGWQVRVRNKRRVTDSVTGLKNRVGFTEMLGDYEIQKRKCYLLYIHLDGFSDVNTRLGRNYGDEILRMVAGRIEETIQGKGHAFSIGGAEYAVLLNEEVEFGQMADDLVKKISEKLVLKGENDVQVDVYVTPKIGVASNIDENITSEELMNNADVTMSFANKSDTTSVVVYNDDVKAKVKRKSKLASLVKEALENGYFYHVYQPQYKLDGRKLRGFESLLRMKLPSGEIVSPAEFIPVAENSSLILEIDSYVLRSSMKQFRDICRKSEDLTLSVNVSAKAFERPDFPKKLLALIEELDFPKKCLEIEITEYSLADSIYQTIENIQKLRAEGIQIALDDFGKGYTSLAQVLRLPITLLKVDKSLIDNVESSDANKDFVKTVIYLGHVMECEVIAEGVEKEGQLEYLKEYNCDLVQGFVWSHPLPYEEAISLAEKSL